MNTYFGSGGLGDLYICFCKALTHNKLDYRFKYIHSLGPAEYESKYHKEFLDMQGVEYELLYNDADAYYKENQNELIGISTCWDGKKSNVIKDAGWLDPFVGYKIKRKAQKVALVKPYIVIQSSAGIGFNKRADRAWESLEFLDNLSMLLAQKLNCSVYIIGRDDVQTKKPNLLNLDLGTHMTIVQEADLFIGFAGFLGFVALTNRVPTILKEHEYDNYYMHPSWIHEKFKNESYSLLLNLAEKKLNEAYRFDALKR